MDLLSSDALFLKIVAQVQLEFLYKFLWVVYSNCASRLGTCDSDAVPPLKCHSSLTLQEFIKAPNPINLLSKVYAIAISY